MRQGLGDEKSQVLKERRRPCDSDQPTPGLLPAEPSSRFHAGVRQRTHEHRLSQGPCVFQDQPECGCNRRMVRGGLQRQPGPAQSQLNAQQSGLGLEGRGEVR